MAAGLDFGWDEYKESPFDVYFTLDELMRAVLAAGDIAPGRDGLCCDLFRDLGELC